MTRTYRPRAPDFDPFAPTPALIERVPLTLRLPVALRDRLATIAADNRRSLNAQILEAIEAFLAREKTK